MKFILIAIFCVLSAVNGHPAPDPKHEIEMDDPETGTGSDRSKRPIGSNMMDPSDGDLFSAYHPSNSEPKSNKAKGAEDVDFDKEPAAPMSVMELLEQQIDGEDELAVEGIKKNKDALTGNRSENKKETDGRKSLSSDKEISKILKEYDKESKEKWQNTKPIFEVKKGRKVLVFDLDKTLIDAFLDDPKENDRKKVQDVSVHGGYMYHVFVRPDLDSLLSELKKNYDLALWSDNEEAYVDKMVDSIKSLKNYFPKQMRLYKSQTDGALMIKDLRKLGIDLKRVAMIDNSKSSFKNQMISIGDKKEKISTNGFLVSQLSTTSNGVGDENRKILKFFNAPETINSGDIRLPLIKKNYNNDRDRLKSQ